MINPVRIDRRVYYQYYEVCPDTWNNASELSYKGDINSVAVMVLTKICACRKGELIQGDFIEICIDDTDLYHGLDSGGVVDALKFLCERGILNSHAIFKEESGFNVRLKDRVLIELNLAMIAKITKGG